MTTGILQNLLRQGEKMITTSVLAKKMDVPIDTVRHYTRIGLLKPGRLETNGYRIYRRSDAVRLRFILAAKELGFTLGEIIQVLEEAENGNSPCPLVREIVAHRIKQNRQKIIDLQQMQEKMEDAQEMWKSMEDSMPDGHSVCHLIESVAGDDSALDL